MSTILDQAHSFGCNFAMEQHEINLDDVDVEFLKEALTSDQGLLEALGSSSTSEDVGSRKESVENFVDTAFAIPCHQSPFQDISNPSVVESAILDVPIQRPVSPVLRSTRRSVRRKVKKRKQDVVDDVKLVTTDAPTSPISALVNQVQCESPSSLGNQKTPNNDFSNGASDHCATSVHSELFIAQDGFPSSVLQSSKSDTNECFSIEEARTCEKLRDTSRKRPRTPCPNDFNPWKKQANRGMNRRRTFSSFGSSLTDLAAKNQAVSNKTIKSSSTDDVSAPSAGKQTVGARVQNASDRDTKWHGPPDSAIKSSSSDINGGFKCLEIASISADNREVLGTVLNTVEQRCAMTHLHAGFTTASNKPIKPSASALKKAQQICNELMSPVPNPSSLSANTVNLSTVSPPSTTSCKETFQSVKLTTKCCENTLAIQSDAVNTKFSTPDHALAVQAISPSGSSNENTETSSFRPVCDAAVQDASSVGRSANSTQSTIASFRTASNKTLSISSAALENANRILVVDDPVSSNPQEFEYSKSPQTNVDCAKQSSTYKRVASTNAVERWSTQKTKSLSDDTVHHVPPPRPTPVKSHISGNAALVTSKNDVAGGRIVTDCGGVDPFADDDALLASYDFTAGDESSVDDVTNTKCNPVLSAQFGSRCEAASVQQKSCATGFTTASNKTVSVSSISMAKARALLQETSQQNDVAVNSEQLPVKLSHVSGAKESLLLTLNSEATGDLIDNASARVQRGSNIIARVFEETTAGIQRSSTSTSVSDISTNTNVASRGVKTKEAVATGFKTASNKILSVTAASLAKAKSMLTDADNAVSHSEPKRLSCDKETSAIDSSRYSEGQARLPIASSGGSDNITSVQCESSIPRPQASILTSGASASLTKSVALSSPARSEPRTKLLFGSCTKARRRNSAYKPPRRKTSLTANVSLKNGSDARMTDSTVQEKKADSASSDSVAQRSTGKSLGVKQTHEEQILLSDESLLMAVELFEDI